MGVVERVVHLRAEQQIGAIAQLEVLEHANAPVVNAGPRELDLLEREKSPRSG